MHRVHTYCHCTKERERPGGDAGRGCGIPLTLSALFWSDQNLNGVGLYVRSWLHTNSVFLVFFFSHSENSLQVRILLSCPFTHRERSKTSQNYFVFVACSMSHDSIRSHYNKLTIMIYVDFNSLITLKLNMQMTVLEVELLPHLIKHNMQVVDNQ